MDAIGMLDDSHTKILEAVDDLPEAQWDVPGACGDWSVKDIIAHLASYEHVLLDTINTFFGNEPTQKMIRCFSNFSEFNKAEVGARRYATAQQVVNDYNETQVQTTSLLAQLPAEVIQQKGTLPWYSADSCLADFIGWLCDHAFEHYAQIVRFRQQDEEQR
jgi:uncharacterized protein (TIGR03083 family)